MQDRVAAINGAVASGASEFAPDKWTPFDLSLFADEIDRLIAVPDSDVARSTRSRFETATFRPGRHCDGWKYLRHECGERTLWQGHIGEHAVNVRAIEG